MGPRRCGPFLWIAQRGSRRKRILIGPRPGRLITRSTTLERCWGFWLSSEDFGKAIGPLRGGFPCAPTGYAIPSRPIQANRVAPNWAVNRILRIAFLLKTSFSRVTPYPACQFRSQQQESLSNHRPLPLLP